MHDFDRALTQHGAWKAAAEPRAEEAFRTTNYLHPFINRVWRHEAVLRRWVRDDVAQLKAVIKGWNYDRAITYQVVQCTLICIQPDVLLLDLSLHVEHTAATPFLWEDLLYQINALRRLYPPYVGATGHAHYPSEATLLNAQGQPLALSGQGASLSDLDYALKMGVSGDQLPVQTLAPHWAYLLAPLASDLSTSQAPWRYRLLGDERAYVLSRISIASTQALRAIDDGNWARLCFADKPGTDRLPYSLGCLADFERQHCYDRWWYRNGESTDAPSRILQSGFSFHWVGSAEDEYFFADPKHGAPVIFEHCYLPLALIAIAQKAALLNASDRLARHGLELHTPEEHQSVEDFYRRFIRFTQSLWHDEVTPQLQGMELFEAWRRHLRLQPLYDEVRQELQDLRDWSEARRARQLADGMAWLTTAAAWVGAAALLTSVVGMWFALAALDFEKLKFPFGPLEAWNPRTALLVVALLPTGFAWWVAYRYLWRKKKT